MHSIFYYRLIFYAVFSRGILGLRGILGSRAVIFCYSELVRGVHANVAMINSVVGYSVPGMGRLYNLVMLTGKLAGNKLVYFK